MSILAIAAIVEGVILFGLILYGEVVADAGKV